MPNVNLPPDPMPTGFIYVDTESTGLDPRRHDAYELAWQIDDEPCDRVLLPHRLHLADPKALEVGRYHERGIPAQLRAQQRDRTFLPSRLRLFALSFGDAYGPTGPRTLVAANPSFDAGMLHGKVIGRERWESRLARTLHLPARPAPPAPWHYRMLDIETYAAAVLGWPRPCGMSTLHAELTARGYYLPAPDHTAAGDVACLRACHLALWDVQGLYGKTAPRIGGRHDPQATR